MPNLKGNTVLLDDASATGEWRQWPGGRGSYSVVGAFDGATVKLQVKGPDGSTPIDVGADTTVTAAAVATFLLPPCEIRAAVTGGTSPSGLYAVAEGV